VAVVLLALGVLQHYRRRTLRELQLGASAQENGERGEEVVRVSEGYRSGLLEDEVEELARQIMGVICDERPNLDNKLPTSAIYERLVEVRKIELPDYAMHDALELVKPMVSYVLGGPQNPDDPADEEAVRRHGGLAIVRVVDPDLCNEL
jgi:hypothetical protein